MSKQGLVLLDDTRLEASPTVANCCMNRERRLSSYRQELRFDPVAFLRDRPSPAWLDLCCGHGRALVEASRELPGASLHGVDLVDTFVPVEFSNVSLRAVPLRHLQPRRRYDLITCVHGLHYLGDKLGAIAAACGWLKSGGLLLAHLDLANLRWEDGRCAGRTAVGWLRGQGLEYRNHRILRCQGPRALVVPFPYVGADDRAGPNYTGQPAVHSVYRRGQ
ncbi:MAG: class I SAM-dependent methyltransferase [Candidatus Eremiobacterota bacterium]